MIECLGVHPTCHWMVGSLHSRRYPDTWMPSRGLISSSRQPGEADTRSSRGYSFSQIIVCFFLSSAVSDTITAVTAATNQRRATGTCPFHVDGLPQSQPLALLRAAPRLPLMPRVVSGRLKRSRAVGSLPALHSQAHSGWGRVWGGGGCVTSGYVRAKAAACSESSGAVSHLHTARSVQAPSAGASPI